MIEKLCTRLLGVVFAALLVMAASPAHADWRRAESANFVVYSDGSESALREYVQKLETFDRILRIRFGLALDETAERKLPIYLVGGRRDLLKIYTRAPDNVVGVYFPTTEGIFAVAIRNEGDDYVLHEYAHHFLTQHFSNIYPGWLTEGLAEYFMTIQIRRDGIDVGRYNENRASWLVGGQWLPLETLLSKRPAEIRRSSDQATYYPVAWLLTHWFLGDRERAPKLQAYLDDINGGGDPVEAIQRATGMSLDDLRQELRHYMRGGLPYSRYPNDGPPVAMTVTRLPASANDLLLLNQRLKVGVATDRRAATLEDVRRAAARHPEDPLALLALGHAGLHFGDRDGGVAALNRLLEIDPNHVEALQFLAQDMITQSREEGVEDPRPMLLQARSYLVRAFGVAPDEYYTLYLIAQMREKSPDYPTANDLDAWRHAYAIAPQLTGVRLGFGAALMLSGQNEAAITLLTPLANAPHGGGGSDAALELIERARAGDAPPSPGALENLDAPSGDPGPESTPPPEGEVTPDAEPERRP